jgi:hypothetical protein
MRSGTRISEPVSTGIAVSRPNCLEVRSSVYLVGMLITPKIVHTMKHTLNASMLTIGTDNACLLVSMTVAHFSNTFLRRM